MKKVQQYDVEQREPPAITEETEQQQPSQNQGYVQVAFELRKIIFSK